MKIPYYSAVIWLLELPDTYGIPLPQTKKPVTHITKGEAHLNGYLAILAKYASEQSVHFHYYPAYHCYMSEKNVGISP